MNDHSQTQHPLQGLPASPPEKPDYEGMSIIRLFLAYRAIHRSKEGPKKERRKKMEEIAKHMRERSLEERVRSLAMIPDRQSWGELKNIVLSGYKGEPDGIEDYLVRSGVPVETVQQAGRYSPRRGYRASEGYQEQHSGPEHTKRIVHR